MNTIGGLALLFILVPILELAILIRMGQFLGFWTTIAVVLLTGVVGAALARLEGMRILLQAQRELAAGRIPGRAMLDGISVLVAGVLLLTPGFLTDIAGISLLFPPTRRLIQRMIQRRLERGIADGSIHVVGAGQSGFGMWGGGPEPRGTSAPPGLDPSKGIFIEPDDSRSEDR